MATKKRRASRPPKKASTPSKFVQIAVSSAHDYDVGDYVYALDENGVVWRIDGNPGETAYTGWDKPWRALPQHRGHLTPTHEQQVAAEAQERRAKKRQKKGGA